MYVQNGPAWHRIRGIATPSVGIIYSLALTAQCQKHLRQKMGPHEFARRSLNRQFLLSDFFALSLIAVEDRVGFAPCFSRDCYASSGKTTHANWQGRGLSRSLVPSLSDARMSTGPRAGR